MKILGIETSCDETAVAIVEVAENNSGKQSRTIKVLSNTISSQVKLHAKYGGVVPNLAAREHVKNIEHVFKLALKGVRYPSFKVPDPLHNIDLIAVTRGPGLGPALLVGITFARTLAWKYQKPLIGVNHLEGHIASNFLKKVGAISNFHPPAGGPISKEETPILNLIVSGGHTELVLMKNHGEYKLIGETLDDAVGEAFDKVARLLGLGYPGGPVISKIAEKGNPDRYPLPSPMIHSKNYDFSYSGLKTAALYLLRDLNLKKIDTQTKCDIAASFQKSAVEVLIKKTMRAAKEHRVKSIFLSGGVSANKLLRSDLNNAAKELGVIYSRPELEYTGDNAAMIALAGYMNYKQIKSPSSPKASAVAKAMADESEGKEKPQELSWDSVEMDANLGF